MQLFRSMRKFFLLFLLALWITDCSGWSVKKFPKTLTRIVKPVAVAILATTCNPTISFSQDYMPIPKCVEYANKEIVDHTSFDRIQSDIDNANWDDLKLFTREYDALFRGGVMKSGWKQMEGINKAARKGDKDDASKYLDLVEQDVKNFYNLLVSLPSTQKAEK